MSEWTTDTLKEHLDRLLGDLREEISSRKIEAEQEREKSAKILREGLTEMIRSGDALLYQHMSNQKESVAAAFQASEKAILKAETSNDKRMESVNEFRGQLSDQVETFITREIYETLKEDTNRRISRMEIAQAQSKTQLIMVGGFISFVVVAVNVVLQFI